MPKTIKGATDILVDLDLIMSIPKACKLLGVTLMTYYAWRKGRPIYGKHLQGFENAMTFMEREAVGTAWTYTRRKLEIIFPDSPCDAWLRKQLSPPGKRKKLMYLIAISPYSRVQLQNSAKRIGVKSDVTGWGPSRRATWYLEG